MFNFTSLNEFAFYFFCFQLITSSLLTQNVMQRMQHIKATVFNTECYEVFTGRNLHIKE